MILIIKVSDENGKDILKWSQTPHDIFITSSVPALHMWNAKLIGMAVTDAS